MRRYPHADSYDPKMTWTISTPTAGIVATTLMVVSTASAIPIVGAFVHTNSSVRLIVQRASFVQFSGTTVVNPLWGAMAAAAITTTGVSAINHATFVGTATPGGFNLFAGATAVSGTAALLYPMGSSRIGGAIAAGGDPPNDTEWVDGGLIISPGTFVGLFGDIATTTGTVRASLTVTAIPRAS